MIPLEQQIRFLKAKILKLENSKALLKENKLQNFVIENEINHLTDLLRITLCLCDDKALQFAECEMCGGLFLVKREKQNVCSGKCRTRLYRKRKQEADHE
jgi:hypothetical protein